MANHKTLFLLIFHLLKHYHKIYNFYLRPVLAFGYCHYMHVSVCLCVCNPDLVPGITHHTFKFAWKKVQHDESKGFIWSLTHEQLTYYIMDITCANPQNMTFVSVWILENIILYIYFAIILQCSTLIMWSNFSRILTTDTPQLSHVSEIWGVFCEF